MGLLDKFAGELAEFFTAKHDLAPDVPPRMIVRDAKVAGAVATTLRAGLISGSYEYPQAVEPVTDTTVPENVIAVDFTPHPEIAEIQTNNDNTEVATVTPIQRHAGEVAMLDTRKDDDVAAKRAIVYGVHDETDATNASATVIQLQQPKDVGEGYARAS